MLDSRRPRRRPSLSCLEPWPMAAAKRLKPGQAAFFEPARLGQAREAPSGWMTTKSPSAVSPPITVGRSLSIIRPCSPPAAAPARSLARGVIPGFLRDDCVSSTFASLSRPRRHASSLAPAPWVDVTTTLCHRARSAGASVPRSERGDGVGENGSEPPTQARHR